MPVSRSNCCPEAQERRVRDGGVVRMSRAVQGEAGDEQADGRDEIAWVGAQHLMHGYCGRASDAPARVPAVPPVLEMRRPIATVRTRPRQARVVRIGPPRLTPALPVDAV
jgi:hypothetical protein